jgi:hypothetical protein
MGDDLVFPSEVIDNVEENSIEFARWKCEQQNRLVLSNLLNSFIKFRRMFFNLNPDASFGRFYHELIDKQLVIWDLLSGISR